ncbi:MAG: DUF4114 domain-containing protein [Bacteroidota bacterium]
MKKNIILVMIYFVALACSTIDEMGAIEEVDVSQEEVFPGDPGTFDRRMHYINRTILFNRYSDANGRSARSTSSGQLNYYWAHIASVDAPVIEGVQLSATHFDIKGNLAYVSYHKRADIHLGALDIIDLTNPHYPTISDQLVFNIADINAITADANGTLWTATSHSKHGAVVYKVPTVGTSFTGAADRYTLSNELEDGVSASANGVCLTDGYVVLSAGKTHGGTFVVDKNTMRATDAYSYSNSKYVVSTEVNGQEYHASLATGDDAILKVKAVDSEGELVDYSLGSITHQNVDAAYRGKSTMEVSPLNSREVYVAMGSEGLKSFDILTGEQLKESKGTMILAGNTNGVTMDEDFMYIANGADGLAISEYPDNGFIDPIFFWDLPEQPASVNFTKASNDYIFVAKGLGGFHILKKVPKAPYSTVTTYNNQGVPENVTIEDVCPDLLPTLFDTALPERNNVMNSNPEYFDVEARNIDIVEDGEVSVTFLHEGAGYKNILGYYTYPTDNPPASVEEVEKVVIFPNASAQGSGGGLIRGHSVELLGTFEAGTSIGFFLISNGWKGKITDGLYTQYTDIPFNQSGRQQSLIFHETSCNAVVIAFEDIIVPNGDNDFNDAIFQIRADPPSAIDVSSYIQL